MPFDGVERRTGDERRENWYSNKEIYEMVQTLTTAMIRTESQIQKYNGLLERLIALDEKIDRQTATLSERMGKQENKCKETLSKVDGASEFKVMLLKMWPVIISTIMMLFTIYMGVMR